MKDLSESTASNLEIDCFKMAFVIYSMGHILAPSTKHDVSVIDYWAAIANMDKIVDFNFCEYVFADLLAACWKVKQDIQNNRPVTHLMGCHLFFQIFYLDNLDLGMLNLPHNSYPRISCFDESRIRKMIIQCTRIGPGPTDFSVPQIRHHTQTCYMRAVWDRKPEANTSSSKKPINPTKKPTINQSHQQQSAGTSSYVSHIPTPAAFTTILKTATQICIVEQMFGTKLLDHEACCLIFRRFNQIDSESLYPGFTPKWRLFIEADFSTFVLAGDNVWDMVSIQKQFTTPILITQIPNTRLFIIPAYLPSGWTVYCWDMKRKIIHMCDPMVDACSYTAHKASHVIIADKLHDALFTCFKKYFKSWHVDSTNWKKNFQFLSATLFARNESGVCMLHIARHFNGIGLASKLSNETLAHQKKLMAAELLQLDGNLGTIPSALKAIFDGHHNE